MGLVVRRIAITGLHICKYLRNHIYQYDRWLVYMGES